MNEDNPLLKRLAGGPIGKTGRKAEKRLISRLGAAGTPASGATRAKGDFVVGEVLGEAKATVSGSLSLKHDWLIKIGREAAMANKVPALTVIFTDDQGKPRIHGSWVMVPETLFLEWLEAQNVGD